MGELFEERKANSYKWIALFSLLVVVFSSLSGCVQQIQEWKS